LNFVLDDLPVLSRSTVDRHESIRDDLTRQRELWSAAQVLLVDPAGRLPMTDGRLRLEPAVQFGPSIVDGAVLLGEQHDVAYWALPTDPRPDDRAWCDLRNCGGSLDATSAGLAVTAVAVLGWHQSSPFCPRCGTRSRFARAGWARQCPSCGLEEYPRTDPAVICLVHDGEGNVLLARQPSWPVGRFSVLAGFVEAGESLEACVRREVAEEVGVAVREIRYLGSQPWPFPRSLMVGFAALAEPGAPVHPAEGEIAEARWFSRDEVRAALTAGIWQRRDDPPDGRPARLVVPGPVSIASKMLTAWAASG
jgi:NAD+ diphosphatase